MPVLYMFSVLTYLSDCAKCGVLKQAVVGDMTH